MQFTGSGSEDAILAWIKEPSLASYNTAAGEDAPIIISHPGYASGVKAHPGYWIVRVEGTYHSYSPSRFNELYELMDVPTVKRGPEGKALPEAIERNIRPEPKTDQTGATAPYLWDAAEDMLFLNGPDLQRVVGRALQMLPDAPDLPPAQIQADIESRLAEVVMLRAIQMRTR
jgi:hypothetical protein